MAASRALIVAVRILLLIVAGSAAAAGVMIAARDPAGDAGPRYVCPMHPEVTAPSPGQCPICRMALEPSGRAAGSSATPYREMPGMADVTAVENVRKHRILDFARHRSLLPSVQELRGPACVEDDLTITAVLYTDQIDALAADEAATLSLTRAPQTTFAVRRTSEPVVPWDRSTSRIRFRLDARRAAKDSARLQPGQVGWLEVARRPREVLAVPAAAVLQSPEGPFVLAAKGGLGFEKRSIEIGETLPKQGFAVVLSGLCAQDRVVSKAAFFLDADRRLGRHAAEGSWSAP